MKARELIDSRSVKAVIDSVAETPYVKMVFVATYDAEEQEVPRAEVLIKRRDRRMNDPQFARWGKVMELREPGDGRPTKDMAVYVDSRTALLDFYKNNFWIEPPTDDYGNALVWYVEFHTARSKVDQHLQ